MDSNRGTGIRPQSAGVRCHFHAIECRQPYDGERVFALFRAADNVALNGLGARVSSRRRWCAESRPVTGLHRRVRWRFPAPGGRFLRPVRGWPRRVRGVLADVQRVQVKSEGTNLEQQRVEHAAGQAFGVIGAKAVANGQQIGFKFRGRCVTFFTAAACAPGEPQSAASAARYHSVSGARFISAAAPASLAYVAMRSPISAEAGTWWRETLRRRASS